MDLNERIIARKAEQELLGDLLSKKSSELISVTGRRRVGKTFLVKQFFQDRIVFQLTGIQNATKTVQLRNFGRTMAHLTGNTLQASTPADWSDAFYLLEKYLRELPKENKLVLFFDELPWIATPKSGFLGAFGHFWNSYAEWENIMVILSGSAASWMIDKVVRHKGGLHNRITQRIHLQPFTLGETKEYLDYRHFQYGPYDISELYMALGGIPYYLKTLSPSLSPGQNLERAVLRRGGQLNDEFMRLYPALFDNADRHISIIRALAKHHYGLSRQQIIAATDLSNGGGLTQVLEELEFSDFIRGYYVFNQKKRYRRYRLIDEYSNFYLRFIEHRKNDGDNLWSAISSEQSYRTWRGYAFENLGLRHLPALRRALGIAGVATSTSTYAHPAEGGRKGLQIDLLIERADRTINLCEFKYYNGPIKLTKAQAERLVERREDFRQYTGTNHTLFTTLISPFGLAKPNNSGGVIDQSITLKELFE